MNLPPGLARRPSAEPCISTRRCAIRGRSRNPPQSEVGAAIRAFSPPEVSRPKLPPAGAVQAGAASGPRLSSGESSLPEPG
eukprot:15484903-Alexandrium_andersonii.AAC.1